LQFCSGYDDNDVGDLDDDDNKDRLFRSLIFLRRNYNGNDAFGEDGRIFDKLVSNFTEQFSKAVYIEIFSSK